MTILYEKVVTHLKERLEKEIQDGVESIVLYGSLARNEAHADSDIDILIVAQDNDRRLYDRISRIRTRIDLDNNTLTTLIQMSRDEFKRYIKLGSPFIESVMKESVILYDRGFFRKLRGSFASKG